MSRRRRAALLFPIVSLTAVVAWAGLGLPSLGLLLEFGRWPSARTTGRTRTLSLRLGEPEPHEVEFVELAPGYVFVDRHTRFCAHPGLGPRVARPLGLASGPPPEHEPRCREWVRLQEPLWIARDLVSADAPAFDSVCIAGIGDFPQQLSFRDESGHWIRLVSEPEYDYACLADAIRPDPRRPEVGAPAETPFGGTLTPPSRAWHDAIGRESVDARIVWIPE